MDSTSAFTCPSCGFRFRVKAKFLGLIAECPAEGCSQKMRLNPPSEPAPPPVAESASDSFAESQDQENSEPSEAKPKTMELHQVNPESVISVVGQTPSEYRRAQRAIRRRANTAPPKPEEKKKIDPTWIGFGAVIGIAAIGWTIWYFVREPARAETSIPAAELPPLEVDSVPVEEDSVEGAIVWPTDSEFLLTSTRPGRSNGLTDSRRVLQEQVLPYLKTYCSDCHSTDNAEAGINIDKLEKSGDMTTERKSWERVFRMIKAGAMPPTDYDPRPSSKEQESMTRLLRDELFNFDCSSIDNPGRPTVQRLNKAEYNNTIRDLFGLSMTPADNFPADDVGEGFDNIGDVLSVPPLLMEKYLDAAETVSFAVIDTRDFSQPTTIRPRRGLYSTNRNKSELRGFKVLDDNGDVIGKFVVPATGEYEIRAEVAATQAGDENAKAAFVVDSKSIMDFEVEGHMVPNHFEKKVRLNAGEHRISVRYLNDAEFDEGPKDRRDRDLGVKSIMLHGPLNGGEFEREAIHKRFVTHVPRQGLSVGQAAAKVLRPIMKKAFRRNVTATEVNRYASLVTSAVRDLDESYEAGLAMALQAILVAPEFLYRLEIEPRPNETQRALNDFEVASRLSYFLWSSMPDDELFRLAEQGKLRSPRVLKQQVRRMLQDRKATAIVDNFAAQWLNLRNLEDVTPNTDVFKSFNDELRDDMRRETELLFETIMKEDRNVADLLSADFTFVNKRLARHYDIEGVDGKEFQRVSLQGTNRSGVLTHGSILTLTSNPGRTSPVKRGKWILDNLLGDSPPPAPPGVPELEETAEAAPDASLREQLAKHREDPGCASCHKVMDPLGLGLENFDAVGRWRTEDEGHPIDASGELPGDRTFNGPLEMIRIVQDGRDKYYRTITEKMLIYAIGRGTQYYDKCAVDKCLEHMKDNGYRFSALVESIVISDPFLKRRAAEKSSSTL